MFFWFTLVPKPQLSFDKYDIWYLVYHQHNRPSGGDKWQTYSRQEHRKPLK